MDILSNLTFGSVQFWLICFIIFAIAEGVTAGLVSIWFCFGSLAAMASSKLGAPVYAQIVIFFVVSVAMFVLTKPFLKKVLKQKNVPTNFDRLIGQNAIVTEKIDNRLETGAIKCEGKIWTARSEKMEKCFEVGDFVTITSIEGVKAIVK